MHLMGVDVAQGHGMHGLTRSVQMPRRKVHANCKCLISDR
jgi:hypothetical protein